MEEITVSVTVESISRLESGTYQVKAFWGTPPVMSRSSDGSLERIKAEAKRKKDAYNGVISLFFSVPVGLCPKIGEELSIAINSAHTTPSAEEEEHPLRFRQREEAVERIKLTENPSNLYATVADGIMIVEDESGICIDDVVAPEKE